MNEFKNFIESKGLHFQDKQLLLLYTAIKLNKPVLLRGLPGTGKTEITKVIAEYLGAEYIFYQCTLGTTEDDLIYKILPSESTKSGVQLILGALPEALKKSQKTRVVLVLDEFDKTRPSCDALLLDFLQNYRVSTRISNSEKVIQGNPENLWVFITSNDEREFSEPLLRRVISIKFEPLKPELVRKILESKGFKEDIITLLVQLYKDTLNAGLKKPATVQELVELGKAIEVLGDQADWSSLVYSYVIKDDYEWQKFIEYLRNRNSDDYNDYNDSEDITEYYENIDSNVEEEEQEELWKPRMPRISVKTVKTEIQEKEVVDREKTVSFMVQYNDDSYDRIVKDFEPEPSNHPAILGDFKVIRDGEEKWIIREDPLTIRDLVEQVTGTDSGVKVKLKEIFEEYYDLRVYVKDKVQLTNDFYKRLTKKFKVLYYTRDLMRFKYYDGVDFILRKISDDNKYWSTWEIEVVVEYRPKDLGEVIKALFENNPKYVVSKIFTEWIEENYHYKEFRVPSDDKEVINQKVNEIRDEIEKCRRAWAEEWNYEPVILSNIKVKLRYGDGSWDYREEYIYEAEKVKFL